MLRLPLLIFFVIPLASCASTRPDLALGAPQVQILEPRDGYVIPSQDITLVFDVDGTVFDGQRDRLRVTVDQQSGGDYLDTKPITLTPMAPGRHTIVLALVGPDNQPRASAVARFIVDPTAKPPPEPRPPHPTPCRCCWMPCPPPCPPCGIR